MCHPRRSTKRDSLSIELALVIALMGILAAGIYLGYNTLMNRTRLTKTQGVLRNTSAAIEYFHNDTDEYPRTLEDLRKQPEGELGKALDAAIS